MARTASRWGFAVTSLVAVAAVAVAVAVIASWPTARLPAESATDGDDAARWAATGRKLLGWGDRTEAIAHLDRALRLRPDDTDLMDALAEALLLGGGRPERLSDHVRALELATRSVELDDRRLAACHNRAQALRFLYLEETAAEVIERCLALEGKATILAELRGMRDALAPASRARPDWSARKEELLAAADAEDAATVDRIVADFPSQVRELVENELLPAWADARIAGSLDNGPDLRVLEQLANGVRDASSDHLAADAIAAVRRAVNNPDPLAAASLARAHRLFLDGAAHVRMQRCGEAEPLLSRAHEAFVTAESPFDLWARFRQAVCDYYRDHYAVAETELATLRREADQGNYRALLGQVSWMEGLVRARQAKAGPSIPHYEAAVDTFASIADDGRLASVVRLLAASLDSLGRSEDAWRIRHASLSRMAGIEDPRTRHQVLLGAAEAALAQGYPRVAVEFERLGVASAAARGDHGEFISGSGRLAVYLHTAGRANDAQRVLAEARRRLPEIADATRGRLDAEVAVGEGRLLLDLDAARAVQPLDEAVRYYEERREFLLAELYPLRGRAHLGAGNLMLAEGDLATAVEFFEAHRNEVFEQGDRISYADVVRGIYDEMIRFQVSVRRRPDVALSYAERGRARLLLESVGRRQDSPAGAAPGELIPLDAEAIRARTPPGVTLVYYTLLEDRLLIWASTGGSLHHVETVVDAMALSADIRELRTLLELSRDVSRSRMLLEQLYDLLVRPITGSLDDDDPLILLPDKALHLIPFAALVDRKTGRFLIQDRAIAVSPSATLLLAAPEAAHASRQGGEFDALIVASPNIDHERYRLPVLRGAEAEASRIHALYEASVLLAGADAISRRFVEEAGHRAVVHFAGHALSDAERPLLSRLLLSPDLESGETGELLARDLYGLDLARTRLVVLAACETAVGRISAGEGAISLSRPFLAAGVPAIVATLWRIDDHASPELFVRFHDAYRRTADPLAAIRQAQLWMLEQDDARLRRPGAWAATQVFLGAIAQNGGVRP